MFFWPHATYGPAALFLTWSLLTPAMTVKSFTFPVFLLCHLNNTRMCLKLQFPMLSGFLKAITFFWSHIFLLLMALSTRWNYSGGESKGIFNSGDDEKAEAICLQKAELVDVKARRNSELIFSVLLLLAKPSMEKKTSNCEGWESHLVPPSKAPCSGSVLPKQTLAIREVRAHVNMLDLETMVWTRHIKCSGPHLYFSLWSNGLKF